MTRAITTASVVVASRKQVSTPTGSEAVVLSIDEGAYYGLNTVGARIWSLIQEPRRVAEVCAVVVEEYDVPPERCERDVLSLLAELADKGLAEIDS